jgi:type II secretory pathway pseudopilin PulG
MTLLELTAALLILSLAVAVAVPAFLNLGREDDLTRATKRVQTLFRLARDSAIHSGQPVTVVLDSVTGLVWVDTPRRLRLGSEDTSEQEVSLFDDPTLDMAAALVGGNEVDVLEPGAPIGLPAAIRMELPRARTRFTFEPSGAALADTLVLVGALETRVVTVDPWTGDVRVR